MISAFLFGILKRALSKTVDAVMYPYDIERVTFPILSKSLKHNVILIPDTKAYHDNPNLKHIGVSPNIVMKSFFISNSFFDFDILNYEPRFTNSAIDFTNPMPILRLNVVLKRLSVPRDNYNHHPNDIYTDYYIFCCIIY